MQQSALALQPPPIAVQHRLLRHDPLQQSVSPEHDWRFAMQHAPAVVQDPVQHCALVEHASPPFRQVHMPVLQSPEQQSGPDPHVTPTFAQQCPPAQPPPQHRAAADAVHVAPPARQPHWFGIIAPHVPGNGHVPQLVVRVVPHVSVVVSMPHAAPRRVQSSADVSGVHPHWFGVPNPPHVSGAAQLPQLATVRGSRQLSSAVSESHVAPCRAQNAASVSGVHAPHTFGTPPLPQRSAGVHVPQSTVRDAPQLSSDVSDPHSAARRAQSSASLSGVQPHTFADPPPPHVSGAAHAPHDSLREAPQLSVASTVPQLVPSRAQSSELDSGTHASPSGPPPPSVAPPSVRAPPSGPPPSAPGNTSSDEQAAASPTHAMPRPRPRMYVALMKAPALRTRVRELSSKRDPPAARRRLPTPQIKVIPNPCAHLTPAAPAV